MENILSPLIIDVQCEDCNERFKLSSEDENKRNSISDNQDFQDEFLNSFDDEVLEVEE